MDTYDGLTFLLQTGLSLAAIIKMYLYTPPTEWLDELWKSSFFTLAQEWREKLLLFPKYLQCGCYRVSPLDSLHLQRQPFFTANLMGKKSSACKLVYLFMSPLNRYPWQDIRLLLVIQSDKDTIINIVKATEINVFQIFPTICISTCYILLSCLCWSVEHIALI